MTEMTTMARLSLLMRYITSSIQPFENYEVVI